MLNKKEKMHMSYCKILHLIKDKQILNFKRRETFAPGHKGMQTHNSRTSNTAMIAGIGPEVITEVAKSELKGSRGKFRKRQRFLSVTRKRGGGAGRRPEKREEGTLKPQYLSRVELK